MTSKEKPILFADLRQFNRRYIGFSEPLAPEKVVMKGQLYQTIHPLGISAHAGDVTELESRISFVELPPAISINILFNGQVNFTLGQQSYQLGNYADDAVECSAFILNRPELLGREFKAGEQVRKVNLFIEKDWLFRRIQQTESRDKLQQLFELHGSFHYWRANEAVISLANTLFDLYQSNSLQTELVRESVMLRLLAEVMEALLAQTQSQLTSTSTTDKPSDLALSQRIDEIISSEKSLSGIAKALGMSISTLQRKFKASYGITVNQYCQKRRLEMAKIALLTDKKSIGEAAYQAGYHHVSNFITAFKKYYGASPAVWLEEVREFGITGKG